MSKNVWLIVSTIPTLILAARGFTITIGEATMDAGLKITDIASQIVFFSLAFGFVAWLLSIIIANIYKRFTGKTHLESNESKSIVDSGTDKQRSISRYNEKSSGTTIAISILAIVIAFAIWNRRGKSSQRNE